MWYSEIWHNFGLQKIGMRNPCCAVGRDALSLCIPNEGKCAMREANLLWDMIIIWPMQEIGLLQRNVLTVPTCANQGASTGLLAQDRLIIARPDFFNLLFAAITTGYIYIKFFFYRKL